MAETMALDAELGAELVDYGDRADLLDDAVIAQCREALKWRGVLLIRGAHLDDDAQVAFSRAFGGDGGVAGGRELTTISMDKKVNKLAEYLRGAFNWHLDDTTHESPLVWKRRDGRSSLVIGATADESRELLDELLALATQSRFCHTHDWAVGDALLWDNTAVLHRALPYGMTSSRMLRRTHVKGQEAWA